MKRAAIIIPTTGDDKVVNAVESALAQTYKNTKVYLVVDGEKYKQKTDILVQQEEYSDKCSIYYLKENTGHSGQNGHRIFSAFSFLIDADYLFYLDQDNYFDENHIESCIEYMEKYNLDWCHSLRKIVGEYGNYICYDDCESLGAFSPIFDYNLVDTSCYCVKTDVARLVSPYFVGGWGHDRRYFQVLSQNFKKFDCTGKYTLNYRLGGDNNLASEFFIQNNERIYKTYGSAPPWRK